MNRSVFKFSMPLSVRNYEVDWQGIVHNAVYLLYFEVARLEYLRRLGLEVTLASIRGESRVVLARNEIDYRTPATFGDNLSVYTRIASIRNTSFVFEGIIEHASTRRVVSENTAVHVWLNGRTGEPERVSDEFRTRVRAFEGDSVVITMP